MKILYMPILLAALIILCGCAMLSPSKEDFDIQYDGAGLTNIHAVPGKVDYEWYTERTDSAAIPQDMGAFIAHYATITPNVEELAALRAWLKKCDFAKFESCYPPHEPETYDKRYDYSLSIRTGNNKYSIAWTVYENNGVPAELWNAVRDLENILKRATESEKPGRFKDMFKRATGSEKPAANGGE